MSALVFRTTWAESEVRPYKATPTFVGFCEEWVEPEFLYFIATSELSSTCFTARYGKARS